jgi:long-subunit acyl-CoA synthetase (AMP-forming)
VPATLIRRTVKTVGCGTTILLGQTEMHGVISQTKLAESPQDQAETVGQRLPYLEVKIADLVDFRLVREPDIIWSVHL